MPGAITQLSPLSTCASIVKDQRVEETDRIQNTEVRSDTSQAAERRMRRIAPLVMSTWVGAGVSLLLRVSCLVLEGVLLLAMGIVSPVCLPPPLETARGSVVSWRRRLGGDPDDRDQSVVFRSDDQGFVKPCGGIGAVSEEVPDLGGRFLDLIAQVRYNGRSGAGPAAVMKAATADMAAQNVSPNVDTEALNPGLNSRGGVVDISDYNEVVLMTDWEADGFLAACLVFATFTAEAKRAVAAGAKQPPYPLKTVLVSAGGGRGGSKETAADRVARVGAALNAMRRAGILPPDCNVDVVAGSTTGKTGGSRFRNRRRTAHLSAVQTEAKGVDDQEREQAQPCLDAPKGSFTEALREVVKQLVRRCWGRPEQRDAARKLRHIVRTTRRQRKRLLVLALKPPMDLLTVMLEGGGRWPRWCGGSGDNSLDHVDLFVAGGILLNDRECVEHGRPRHRSSRIDSQCESEPFTSQGHAEIAMSRVGRVFVAELRDLAGFHGFPAAITPDRTPVLAAAIAGARGDLSSELRRMIANSNLCALMDFPERLALATSRGRYTNETLRCTAVAIATAAAEPGVGWRRISALGACMADLIASDFEALEAAGLRPESQQAVFRSMDAGMALGHAAAAWALVSPDAVCWERCPKACVDLSSGRVVPGGDVHTAADAGGHPGRHAVSPGCATPIDPHEYDEDELESLARRQSEKRVLTTSGYGRGAKVSRIPDDGSNFARSNRIVTGSERAGNRPTFGATLATGFAEGFERLDDQEAGYTAFATFLVRVLDQMP